MFEYEREHMISDNMYLLIDTNRDEKIQMVLKYYEIPTGGNLVKPK